MILDVHITDSVTVGAMDVVWSASKWVEGIHDHPSNWAGDEEFDLIRAVRSLFPNLRCRWTEEPGYEAWHDTSDPRNPRGDE